MSCYFVFAQGSEWSVGIKRAGMGRAFQAEGRASGNTLKTFYYVYFFLTFLFELFLRTLS